MRHTKTPEPVIVDGTQGQRVGIHTRQWHSSHALCSVARPCPYSHRITSNLQRRIKFTRRALSVQIPLFLFATRKWGNEPSRTTLALCSFRWDAPQHNTYSDGLSTSLELADANANASHFEAHIAARPPTPTDPLSFYIQAHSISRTLSSPILITLRLL